eukprot:5049088-Alexandrium_andersonii.AAC.2
MPSLLSPSRLPDRPLLQTGWVGTCFNATLLLGGETQTPCASIASATVVVFFGVGVDRLAAPPISVEGEDGATRCKVRPRGLEAQPRFEPRAPVRG